MRMYQRLFGATLIALVFSQPAIAQSANCNIDASAQTHESFAASLTQTGPMASDLLAKTIACLGETDPAIRDGLALTVLTLAMRNKAFPVDHLRAARDQLLPMLSSADDPAGVRAPFAAMVLSEVARHDLVNASLTPPERRALAAAGTAFVQTVTDYRGYTDGEGWRHGIAHGGDWLAHMSRHPELHADDAAAFLKAIGSQVAPPVNHAYIHGEHRRLARPVLYLALNKKVSDAQLWAFLGSLKPDDSARWNDPYGSEIGLAALHNTRAFAMTLLVEALSNKDPALRRLEAPVLDLLSALP
jgi:Protein of unknown function (DUF2785)